MLKFKLLQYADILGIHTALSHPKQRFCCGGFRWVVGWQTSAHTVSSCLDDIARLMTPDVSMDIFRSPTLAAGKLQKTSKYAHGLENDFYIVLATYSHHICLLALAEDVPRRNAKHACKVSTSIEYCLSVQNARLLALWGKHS